MDGPKLLGYSLLLLKVIGPCVVGLLLKGRHCNWSVGLHFKVGESVV